MSALGGTLRRRERTGSAPSVTRWRSTRNAPWASAIPLRCPGTAGLRRPKTATSGVSDANVVRGALSVVVYNAPERVVGGTPP
jgi:hypothetical protein